MRNIKLFFKWAKKDFWIFLISFVFLIIQAYLFSLVPVFTGKIFAIIDGSSSSTLPAFFDLIIKGSKTMQISMCVVMFFVVSLLAYLSEQLYYFIIEVFSVKIAQRARAEYFSKIQAMPYEKYVQFESSDLLSRCMYSTDNLTTHIGSYVIPFFKIIVNFIFILVQMFMILQSVTYLIIVCVVLKTIVFLFFYKKLKNCSRMDEELKTELVSDVKENYNNIRLIKMYNMQDEMYQKSADLNKRLEDVKLKWNITKSTKRDFYDCIISFVMYFIFFALIFNAVLYANIISASSAIAVIGLLWSFDSHETSFNTNLIFFAPFAIDFERITDFYNLIEPQNTQKTKLRKGKNKKNIEVKKLATPEIFGKIEFKNVSLEIEERSVLKNFSFTINPNKKMIISSSSGEQQTAIFLLLKRCIEDYSGEILVDDVNIRKIDPDYLNSKIALVEENPYIFSMNSAKILYKDSLKQIIKNPILKAIKAKKLNFTKASLKMKNTIIAKLKIHIESDAKVILLDNILSSITSRELNQILELEELKNKTVIITNNVPSYKIYVDKEICINNRKKVISPIEVIEEVAVSPIED